MAFARNSLDVIIVASHPDTPLELEAMTGLERHWIEKGWLDEGGHPVASDQIIKGGFSRLLLDKPEKVLLYANHQGGYRVRCPNTQENIAFAFSRAVHHWRKGGPRELECPACQLVHPLEEIPLQPRGAFSNGALLFRGAEAIQLSEAAWRDIEKFLGPTALILRRLA